MSALNVSITRKFYPPRAGTPGHLAIAGLEFSVAESEFVCILGPSGCGKTTLLNLIAGLDGGYEGQISLTDGIAEHLAYVFQTPRLLPWRTVRENIALVLGHGEADTQIVTGLIVAVGLEGFSDAYPGQLSLGMQRRAALARAFARDPRILLMDEPFVSLDEAAAERLRALLIEILAERPTIVLFVTHDRREAAKLADRILVLSGAPATLANEVHVTLSPTARSDPDRIEAFCRKYLPAFVPDPGGREAMNGQTKK
jgi:NitT/TauT family transport system ATP-binding protein